jgi:hypothetical protein
MMSIPSEIIYICSHFGIEYEEPVDKPKIPSIIKLGERSSERSHEEQCFYGVKSNAKAGCSTRWC